MLAETEAPEWGTSPSYPPSEVIDRSRLAQASSPALVDMAGKYPHLHHTAAYRHDSDAERGIGAHNPLGRMVDVGVRWAL